MRTKVSAVGDQKYHLMPHLLGTVRKLSVPYKGVYYETKAYPFKYKIFLSFNFLSSKELSKYFYFNCLSGKNLNFVEYRFNMISNPLVYDLNEVILILLFMTKKLLLCKYEAVSVCHHPTLL